MHFIIVLKETDPQRFVKVIKGFDTVSLAFSHYRKHALQVKLDKIRAAPKGFEPGTSANRSDALTTEVWCSFDPQGREYDMSPLRCTY